jgi:hypothetical protein
MEDWPQKGTKSSMEGFLEPLCFLPFGAVSQLVRFAEKAVLVVRTRFSVPSD